MRLAVFAAALFLLAGCVAYDVASTAVGAAATVAGTAVDAAGTVVCTVACSSDDEKK